MTERPSKNERTTQEAAILLGLKDAASVRNLYLRGDLTGRLVGRVLWIPLRSIESYAQKRRSPGRPEGSITGESQNKRGPSQTEYQREYKRKLRAGLIKPNRRRSKKKS